MQTFGIIGLGKLGLSLSLGLSSQGLLSWAMNRGQEQRAAASFLLPNTIPIFASVSSLQQLPSCVIIAVADNAIDEVSLQLAQKFEHKLSDVVVLHCSGARRSDALAHCAEHGAIVAGLHPYQTFSAATAKNFRGIAWGAELPQIEPYRTIAHQSAELLVKSLGGNMVYLSPETIANKPLYHASAVFAANYLNTLVALAAQTAHAAGIQPAEFLPAILQRAMENALLNLKQPSASQGKLPLTGPIARGDIATVQSHLESFRTLPNAASIIRPYCLFGLAAAEFACKQGLISETTQNTLMDVLQQELQRA